MPPRMNRRSLNPSKIAPLKKDSSHLDWHYKTPPEEELEDRYPCIAEDMWPLVFQAAKESISIPTKKRGDIEYLRNAVKRQACADCTIPYQMASIANGTCQPVEGAVTPLERGDEEE